MITTRARDLPTGTLTFLFTDVEGSTKLLHSLGAEAYADELAEHRRVIRAACTAEGGVEVDTQGDAFFFAFPTAPGAGPMGVAGSGADADWLEMNRAVPRLYGERVLLREWTPHDLAPFAALNADPRVMEHLPSPLTRSQSDGFVRERILPQFAERGFGLWAVEVPEVAPFVGYVGLFVHTFETEFTPCVEIGWRLAYPNWGKGYATEAARIAVAFGFEEKGLDEIVSFTVPANRRSVAVMERLGMSYAGEFDHPRLPAGHRLRRHVLYRLSRP